MSLTLLDVLHDLINLTSSHQAFSDEWREEAHAAVERQAAVLSPAPPEQEDSEPFGTEEHEG